jgi:hypothetical protein
MDPHTTKVLAEKKLMKSESAPIPQGTDAPPEKKPDMFFEVRMNTSPMLSTNTEKTVMTTVSACIMWDQYLSDSKCPSCNLDHGGIIAF